MSKLTIDGVQIVLPDHLDNDQVKKVLDRYFTKYHEFNSRKLIMRRSDGTEYQLMNGVRKHGKRHTS